MKYTLQLKVRNLTKAEAEMVQQDLTNLMSGHASKPLFNYRSFGFIIEEEDEKVQFFTITIFDIILDSSFNKKKRKVTMYKDLVEALVIAVNNKLMTKKKAVKFLKSYLKQFIDNEK